MRKIKYVFLTTVDISLKSFMLPIVSTFSKEKYDITLMSSMTDEFYDKYSKEYACVKLDLKRGFSFRKTLSCIFKLIKEFKKLRPDIIEYGTENVSFCAAIAGWFTRVPIRIYNHWGARYTGLSGLSKTLSIIIERIAALFSTDIRQVSHKNREMCVKDHIYPAKKVKVLGLGGTVGVDCTKFDLSKKEQYCKEVRDYLNIPREAFVFGFIGRIQKDKGIDELLEAFKNIAKENIYLLLIGPLEYTEQLSNELLDWANNNENVIFSGKVSDVYRYISAFDVMVHPSYREGFGMVLQEAGAMKTPVITTDILGPNEFITDGENGLLVPAKRSVELTIAMKRLLNDDKLRLRLGEKIYKHTLKNFERSVMVDRIIEDRESLLRRKEILL